MRRERPHGQVFLLLLCGAAAGPLAHAGEGVQPSTSNYPNCVQLLQAGGSATSTLVLGMDQGVTQEFSTAFNASACSLRADASVLGTARIDVLRWDPQRAAPDSTTIALRSRVLGWPDLHLDNVLLNFEPPLVLRCMPHLADPPAGSVAVNYEFTIPGTGQLLYFASNGPAATPAAYQYSGNGHRIPLPGPHPALGHSICGGDAALQALFVTQSIMSTNTNLGYSAHEYLQRFRVPFKSRLAWIELAFGPTPDGSSGPGLIAILDAQDVTSPPEVLPPSLVEAPFNPYLAAGERHWASHAPFDHAITLEPGHDYFLLVRTAHNHRLFGHTITGTESADYAASVGDLVFRTVSIGAWTPQTSRSLCFQFIGEPIDALVVPSTTVNPGALRLRIAPNPSRGAAFVTWAGAGSSVRFEVLDARGRRVAENTGEGHDGRWLWSAAQTDGRPLPAGVYFMRARDNAGQSAVERVVLVR